MKCRLSNRRPYFAGEMSPGIMLPDKMSHYACKC